MTVTTTSTSLLADDDAVTAAPSRHRVLTGDRPTGPLHLGHYFGTLRNRVRLQRLGVDTFLVVADYQVITDRAAPGEIAANVHEVVLDNLAAGIDPRRTTIFAHSAVPALNQLMLPFLALTTVAELRRNPTVKDEAASAGVSSLSGLLLTYPVHQAADILFCHGTLVPVGQDQLPHVEQTRQIARRFNDSHGGEQPVFTEPQALLSPAPRLLGIDGTKMSKSRGNAIDLRASEDDTARLVRRAVTDDERVITYDPQTRPGVSSLVLTAALATGQTPESVAEGIGPQGSSALKALVTEAVNEELRPVRARRAEYAAEPGLVERVLLAGAERANAEADRTLQRVHTALGMKY
ncbi:tryptophanyl-tRNA synthetase [Haloactinopolyspora alba]|uniref:Tryptophan--tRNA ligase n=1 Tax=Haloactinopolyspora alba TaxID=648780 RepID=A0A2P8E541_9ACTN|nr:tryptophan--tRNA ligase [Haloactinopolyspora alba]PSL04589.1 tryptophanyl-tRNA synthetase [Haloactinopolyspora alba]